MLSPRRMLKISVLPVVVILGGIALAGARAGVTPSATAAIGPADLSVTESGSPDVAAPGDLVTFTITVQNGGPSTADYANMSDPLPAHTSFVALSWPVTGAVWECDEPAVGASGKLSCTSKSFGVADAVTFTLTVSVDRCAGDGALTNTVTVASLNPDPNYRDNVATVAPAIVDPGTCEDGDACTVGDRCTPGIAFTEDFDAVIPSAVPSGWTTTVVVGPDSGRWRTGNSVFDTPPNSVFVLDAPELRDSVLDSPSILILSDTAQLHFMNRYNLEYAADGGVLEVSVGNSAFRDIVDAGGQFESGGYDTALRSDQHNPIGGRMAWTGLSPGTPAFRPTVIDLPATFAGKLVVFRWRMATDQSLGWVGQWIDSIFVTGPYACRSGSPLLCDDNDACTVDSCDSVSGCRHDASGCDDGNPCTDDSCNAVQGCVHANNNVLCNDFNACTRTDRCVGGVCVGSNPPVCDDGDSCTADACDPGIGCVAPNANFNVTGYSAGRVDGRDLEVLAAAWNSCPANVRYNAAVNLDPQTACIDQSDFHLFMNAFGRVCPP